MVVEFAQAEAVADRDLALETRRQGALGDAAQFEGPERAAVVKVDVDPDAVFLRDAEDDAEVALHVAVDARGIEVRRRGRHRRRSRRP